jgi:hypothetical protein
VSLDALKLLIDAFDEELENLEWRNGWKKF